MQLHQNIAITIFNGDNPHDDELFYSLGQSVALGLWLELIRIKRADNLQIWKGLLQFTDAFPSDIGAAEDRNF